MKKPKRLLFIPVVIFLFLLMGVMLMFIKNNKRKSITTFQNCKDAGYVLLESYPEQCNTPDGRRFVADVKSVEITIQGEIVCLPDKNKTRPRTLECAIGLKDSNGYYYSLKDKSQAFINKFVVGSKVTIKGKLNSETSVMYDVIGSIDVESLKN